MQCTLARAGFLTLVFDFSGFIFSFLNFSISQEKYCFHSSSREVQPISFYEYDLTEKKKHLSGQKERQECQLRVDRRSLPEVPPQGGICHTQSITGLVLRACCCLITKSCLTVYDPWTAACQASLSFTISQSWLKLMSIESVMPSSVTISSPSPPAFNLSQHQGLFQ